MLPFDVRNFDDARREALAWQAHERADTRLPRLTAWNYDLCRRHRNGWVETYYDEAAEQDAQRTVYDRPQPECRQCGIHLRAHQRVGVLWLYLKKRALLADTMGTGKTANAGGLIALLLETGELADPPHGRGRVIIAPRAPALGQWHDELLRMMPGLRVGIARGPRRDRINLYMGDWQALLIGPEMLRRDAEILERVPLAALIADDVDELRHSETTTSYNFDRLGRRADRYVIMNGTPLQKRLPELHAVLDAIDTGGRALGDIKRFERDYVRTETVNQYVGRIGREVRSTKVVGYKNTEILKQKIAPMILRRTINDLTDVTLPGIITDDVMLDLYPAQRAKYTELQRGVLRIIKDGSVETKRADVLTRIHYGAAICAGLATLGEDDGPGASVKLDWLIDKVRPDGELGDEKVVVYCKQKRTIRALHARLAAVGVGFETIWGEAPDPAVRQESQRRFWDDPSCRILLGTSAIVSSLNLQVARRLVNVDLIMNFARMEQLAGRVRRQGSAHQHVFVHNLLTVNTQEERYLPKLEREAGLAGHIWDEESPLFQALSPLELASLITG